MASDYLSRGVLKRSNLHHNIRGAKGFKIFRLRQFMSFEFKRHWTFFNTHCSICARDRLQLGAGVACKASKLRLEFVKKSNFHATIFIG